MQASQQGSGSAENRGQDRADQLSPATGEAPRTEKIKESLGNDSGRLSSIRELGGLSGRDDISGGSGNRMEEQSTGQQTDK